MVTASLYSNGKVLDISFGIISEHFLSARRKRARDPCRACGLTVIYRHSQSLLAEKDVKSVTFEA